MSEKITESSGNVFSDLGFLPEEAENLRIRSELMMSIKCYIKERGWNQIQAAENFGVAQPRISEIFQGKIELYSVDKLINMLSRVGQHISIKVSSQAA
jgi:predicted XRE-type DNA-binding protein